MLALLGFLTRRLTESLRLAAQRQVRARESLRAILTRELLGKARARAPRTDDERIAAMQREAQRRLKAAVVRAIVKPFVMAALRQEYIAIPELSRAAAEYVSARLDAREIRARQPINRLRVAFFVAFAMSTLEAVAYAAARRQAVTFDSLRSNMAIMTRRGDLAEMRAFGYKNRAQLREARRKALLETSFSHEFFKSAAYATVNAVILAAMRQHALTLSEYRRVRERAHAVMQVAQHQPPEGMAMRALRAAQGAQAVSAAATAFEPVVAAAFRKQRIVLPRFVNQLSRACAFGEDGARSIAAKMYEEMGVGRGRM